MGINAYVVRASGVRGWMLVMGGQWGAAGPQGELVLTLQHSARACQAPDHL